MDLIGLEGAQAVGVLIGSGLILTVLIVAVWQRIAVVRDVRSLAAIAPNQGEDTAFAAVVAARSRFAAAVNAYEVALASPVPEPAVAGGAPPRSIFDRSQPATLEELEAGKDRAREELLAAQSRWKSTKTSNEPISPLGLWFGSGILRGWNLGPVGYESVVIRIDHAIDESCWSVWRLGRIRLGLAVGVEKQRLALFVFGARPEAIRGLLGRGFGGTEAAIRPGIALGRTWRRLRRDKITRWSVDAVLDEATSELLTQSPSAECRARVVEAFEYELGGPLDALDDLPGSEAMLAMQTRGPAFVLGAWGGREPRPRLVSRSGHSSWE